MSSFYNPPRLRLADEKIERHATWLELFFDLVFVVAVTQLGDRLSQHLDFTGIWQFIALFMPVWWAWAGHTVYSTRFDTDDMVHRLVTFIMMFAAAIMAVQIPTALEQGATGFAVGFIISRVSLLFLYARALYHIPKIKSMARLYLIGFGLGILCWCISIPIPAPEKFIWWALGLFIDFSVPWIGKKRILEKAPLDTTHIPERFGLFTTIVLGETILAVILGLTHTNWYPLSIITAILAFILGILIWWLYYTYMQNSNYKCSLSSGQPFIYGHLPLVISLVIIGICAERLIESTQNFSLHRNINITLASAVIVWLLSFAFLQHVSLKNLNVKFRLVYISAIVIISLLFFNLPLTSLMILGLLDSVFFALLIAELYALQT